VPYRLLFVRRLFLGVGTTEKVAELRSAGTIGAGLTVVLTLTFPDGVSVVFVRMRIVPPKFSCFKQYIYPKVGGLKLLP
jgi:hypothetical protein